MDTLPGEIKRLAVSEGEMLVNCSLPTRSANAEELATYARIVL